jgi:hypothetical protein
MQTPEDSPFVQKRNSDYMYLEHDPKRQGFLGLFHPYNGRIYASEGIREDDDLYQAYFFGENAIMSMPSYGGYDFKDNLEKHCIEYDVNRIYGIIRPPSEQGFVNNPSDRDTWKPLWPNPGMIQGAKRFSELSKIFPQIAGIIIDDFWANYGDRITFEDLRDIKDALLGKSVNDNGEVDHQSPVTTPQLRLFVVTYERELHSPNRDILELIDGINFWVYNQKNSYKNFNKYIEGVQTFYPGKEIISGVYIKNGDYGDMSHESIAYLIERSIDLYDRGHVTGVLLFSGYWLVKDYISRERSAQINLSYILKNKYYPFLGEVRGQVFDQTTGKPIEKALVKITSSSPGSEKFVAQKFTNAAGSYRFSGWGGYGIGGMDYTIHVEHEEYEINSVKIKLLARNELIIPAITIKPKRTSTRIDKSIQIHENSQISSYYCEHSHEVMYDLMLPYCVSIILNNQHIWSYKEDEILSVLNSVKYEKEIGIWNLDYNAIRGISAVKERLPSCPCGITIGKNISNGMLQAAIIYWINFSSWRIWDPYSQSHVKFDSKYIII